MYVLTFNIRSSKIIFIIGQKNTTVYGCLNKLYYFDTYLFCIEFIIFIFVLYFRIDKSTILVYYLLCYDLFLKFNIMWVHRYLYGKIKTVEISENKSNKYSVASSVSIIQY